MTQDTEDKLEDPKLESYRQKILKRREKDWFDIIACVVLASPFLILFAKVIIWDALLGWGSTGDLPSGYTVPLTIIILIYFFPDALRLSAEYWCARSMEYIQKFWVKYDNTKRDKNELQRKSPSTYISMSIILFLPTFLNFKVIIWDTVLGMGVATDLPKVLLMLEVMVFIYFFHFTLAPLAYCILLKYALFDLGINTGEEESEFIRNIFNFSRE